MNLRIWWIPQVPLSKSEEPFYRHVGSVQEAKKILDLLADYDIYQLEHNIKPDYSNAGGLERFDGDEWVTWTNEDGFDLDEYFDLIAEEETK